MSCIHSNKATDTDYSSSLLQLGIFNNWTKLYVWRPIANISVWHGWK